MSLSMQQQQQVEWRRAKVLELMSKGETSQSEIARILQVDKSTICRDVDYLRQQAKENIARYVNERLPEEYEKCLVGLNSILKEAWTMSQTENVKGDKIKALALAKECYAMKLELLTNATVVDDAIRFVSSHAAATEKDNAGYGVTLDKDEGSDIQRSDECYSQEQQHSTATNNSIF
jgi:DeoR/GlpR family transcriptional regulator of sugar metabolism